MTFVVTEACIRCKYTECVPECPVNAIYAEEDVPAGQQNLTPLNAELSREWKSITKTKLALPESRTHLSLERLLDTGDREFAVRWRATATAAERPLAITVATCVVG